MFGVSFGEALLLLIIGIVVIGPRNLPQMMRSLGKTIAKVRRMTTDLRSQSGIDEILKAEGIEKEVQELRKLATGRLMDVDLNFDEGSDPNPITLPPRAREYPSAGVDAAFVLPEETAAYAPLGGAVPRGALGARGASGLDDPYHDPYHDAHRGEIVEDAPRAGGPEGLRPGSR